MARPTENDLVSLGPFTAGSNNLAREDGVPANACRRFVNGDFYPDGRSRRRKGMTQVDATPVANLWCGEDYPLCTSLDGTVLLHCPPGQAMTTLFTGLAPEHDTAYCAVNHLVYVSDAQRALRVDTLSGDVRPWGLPTPVAQPLLTATDGGLAPGNYQVAITYTSVDGEEGGARQAATIELPTGGAVRAVLPALPVPAHVARINLYFTRANDAVLAHYASYPVGTIDVVLGPQSLGRELRTMGLEPMPAGHAAALVGGRLVVAVDNMLVISDALNYGLTNLAKSFVMYPSRIDLLAPTSLGAAADGVFLAAGSKTYFLAGDSIASSVNRLAYGHGAVPGAPAYVNGDTFGVQGLPPQPLPVWLATNGSPCVGLPSGQVLALTAGRYAMLRGDRVVLARRNIEGVDQLLFNVRSPSADGLGITGDFAEATLIRNGVPVP